MCVCVCVCVCVQSKRVIYNESAVIYNESGCIKALLHIYAYIYACMCVYSEAADERHMKMY